MRRAAAATATAVLLLASPRAFAAEQPSVDAELEEEEEDFLDTHGNLRTRAETVSFDARQKVLELSGDVRVDSPPFHLRSQRIKLTRTKLGIEVEGKGRLAFCPCLGTPLTVEFEKAFVAPPGDLIIKSPTLEFYGVPIFYLPWFWLRSDEKPGVLPPEIAYRGKDGLFVGEGVHLPWKRQGKRFALDLRAGAYLFDGFASEARLGTPVSHTKIRHDRLRGDDGLGVDARGATDDGELRTAWDVDVLRGARGVRMTTDLDAASKPWDRGTVEGALRTGPFTLGQSMRVITRRGERVQHVESAGPVTTLRASGPISDRITYDATVEGGALRLSRPTGLTPDTLSFVRSEVGATGATNLGPFGGTLALRSANEVAREGTRAGGVSTGTARAHVGLPLVRAYRSVDEPSDPLLHVVEPFVEAAALAARGRSLLGTAPGRLAGQLDTDAALGSGGITTSLGRWGSRGAIEATFASGAMFVRRRTVGLYRGRLSASSTWLGATVDAAGFGVEDVAAGDVLVARARFGPTNGLRLLGNVASRGRDDAALARFLVNETYEPSADLLARSGTTGGTTLVFPWHRAVTTTAGADYDATNQELVGARGGVEIRDRCGCLTLRVNGSHRIGRPGVDVWVALDFAADR